MTVFFIPRPQQVSFPYRLLTNLRKLITQYMSQEVTKGPSQIIKSFQTPAFASQLTEISKSFRLFRYP